MDDWESNETEAESSSVGCGESEASGGDVFIIEDVLVSHNSDGCPEVQPDGPEDPSMPIESPNSIPCRSEDVEGYRLEGEPGIDPWEDNTNFDREE